MTRKTPSGMEKSTALPAGYAGIHGDIVGLLGAARQSAARSVNALMTASYWAIGRRVVEAEQKGRRRAGYGEQLLERLATDLTAQFGRGFGVNNLENMRRFFLAFPCSAISQTVSGKFDLSELAQVFALPWSAYVRLLTVKDEHTRRFIYRYTAEKASSREPDLFCRDPRWLCGLANVVRRVQPLVDALRSRAAAPSLAARRRDTDGAGSPIE